MATKKTTETEAAAAVENVETVSEAIEDTTVVSEVKGMVN